MSVHEYEIRRRQDILAIAQFLGHDIEDGQVDKLMREIDHWDIESKYYLVDYCHNCPKLVQRVKDIC